MALLNLPRNCKLYHGEPFGPVDSVAVVDSVDQMVAEMNVSNGSLVSSLASDDAGLAKQIAGDLRCFKFGHNKVRSRGIFKEVRAGFWKESPSFQEVFHGLEAKEAIVVPWFGRGM